MLSNVILVTSGQILGDLLCCIFSFIYATAKKHANRIFFIVSGVSFLSLGFGDIHYNYFFRILHTNIRSSIDLIDGITILIFQLSQAYNWFSLIKKQQAVIISKDNAAYLLFTVIVVGVLVYYFLTGNNPVYKDIIYQIINITLDMLVWLFAIICLAKTRSLSIILLSSGCLLIISSALTTDCLFMFAMNKVASAASIHIIWMCGVLIMAAGFATCWRNKAFEFCPTGSLQIRFCSWLSITSLAIVLMGSFLLSIFNLEFHLNIGSLLWTIPIVLVFTMIASVLLGCWFSNNILLPVRHSLKQIEIFNSGQHVEESHYNTKLYEFKVLGDFINASFKELSSQLDREIKMAAQVAHDIRSPLSALEVVIKRLPEVEESKRFLLRDAVNHIRDITNNLEKTKNASDTHESKSVTNIGILLDYVVSERRAAFTNQRVEITRDFEPEGYKFFVNVIQSVMKRVLTNIINNACEAVLPNGGVVNVNATLGENLVVISVSDNGAGVSKEVSALLFTRGITTKKNGSGLGLYHARESLAQWGGTIDLMPRPEFGTIARITLPLQNSPTWYVSSLSFLYGSTVVCVDDSISIWHAWQEKFSTLNGKINLHYCSSKEDLLHQMTSVKKILYTYLVDYEFSGSFYTGLELIEIILSKKIPNSRVFLVTSRSSEVKVREFCELRGIYLIPKFFALNIPLRIIKTRPKIVFVGKAIAHIDFQMKFPNFQNDEVLFYREWNDIQADLTLFNKSSIFYLDRSAINEMMLQKLCALGFSAEIFDDMNHPAFLEKCL